MNSEERHHLHENELNKVVMQSYDWVGKHGQQLLVLIAVAAVASAGWTWWSHELQVSNSDAWTKYSLAKAADDFATVAKDHPNTLAAAWSQLKEGELRLEQGLQEAFTDRTVSSGQLKNAEKAFTAVLSNPATAKINELRDRAQWGLAQALEGQCDGTIEPVIKAYEKVPESSIFAPAAKTRIELLKKSGAEFYAWFSKEKPAPAAPSKPKDFGSKAPRLPEDLFPPLSDEKKDIPKGEEVPATPDKKEQPASEKSEAPASATTPETSKPEAPAKDEKKPE